MAAIALPHIHDGLGIVLRKGSSHNVVRCRRCSSEEELRGEMDCREIAAKRKKRL